MKLLSAVAAGLMVGNGMGAETHKKPRTIRSGVERKVGPLHDTSLNTNSFVEILTSQREKQLFQRVHDKPIKERRGVGPAAVHHERDPKYKELLAKLRTEEEQDAGRKLHNKNNFVEWNAYYYYNDLCEGDPTYTYGYLLNYCFKLSDGGSYMLKANTAQDTLIQLDYGSTDCNGKPHHVTEVFDFLGVDGFGACGGDTTVTYRTEYPTSHYSNALLVATSASESQCMDEDQYIQYSVILPDVCYYGITYDMSDCESGVVLERNHGDVIACDEDSLYYKDDDYYYPDYDPQIDFYNCESTTDDVDDNTVLSEYLKYGYRRSICL